MHEAFEATVRPGSPPMPPRGSHGTQLRERRLRQAAEEKLDALTRRLLETGGAAVLERLLAADTPNMRRATPSPGVGEALATTPSTGGSRPGSRPGSRVVIFEDDF